jgi:integrase
MSEKKRKRTYGSGTVSQGHREGTWELRYTPPGSRRLSKTIEAPWTTKGRTQAEDALKDWRKHLDRQQNPGVRLPMSLLFTNHLKDMRREGRDAFAIRIEEQRIKKHLEQRFGHFDANALKLSDITDYKDDRLEAGAARATINRELAALRRSLSIGVEQGLLTTTPPRIPPFKENNVRKGFVEWNTYRAILRELPPHAQIVWCFAYYLGIRKGELLKFRWEWLLPYWTETEPIIKVPGEFCKSGEPHTIPIYHPEMRAFVQMAMADRNPNCSYLFQYRGRRLTSLRTAFELARERANVPKLIFHDTRRTAIRLMEKAGIPRAEAMQITGHKTESVYKRYDLASERGATETGRRMREFHSQLSPIEAKLGDKLGDEVLNQTSVLTSPISSKSLN